MPARAFSWSRIAAATALASCLPLASAARIPDGWFAWPATEPATGSALDASALNAAPAGAAGRILVRDGRFVTPDGRRVRFVGVNITSADAFPTAAEAEQLARRLAKAGINIARLHHIDNPWGIGEGGSLWRADRPERLELDPAQLDRLHRLIATLARHGIYTNVNLKVSKTLGPADGFPASVAEFPDFQKRVDLFDRRMIELQKDYARRLLTTKNPYTGLAPVDDPAVAVVEINNENSVLGYFTRDLGRGVERFPEPFREDLRLRWNDWLARRYGGTAALRTAWFQAPAAASSVLAPGAVRWSAKAEPGSAADLVLGAGGDSFRVAITRTTGVNWHVQVSTYGLRLTDNAVYAVSFEARAEHPTRISVGVANDNHAHPGQEWRSLGVLQPVEIGTEWKPVRIVFPAHSVAGDLAKLNFDVAERTGALEIRGLAFTTFSGHGLAPDEQLEQRTIGLPGEPTTRQWADWIEFLAEIDRRFAEEMRAYLRDELGVRAPMACSQINFSGLPALDREQSMDFADTHAYWQHPLFPGASWDRAVWTIANSPQVSVLGPRHFGELGQLAVHRVAGKPFAVSEYDHAAPSEFACEMYPQLAVFAARQDWDAVYAFDLGSYGARNRDGRITGFFDQINHPAKWSLVPLAARVFRGGLIPPAGVVAEVVPGTPVWSDAMQFDMLWAKVLAGQPFDFLDTRLQVRQTPAAAPALERRGTPDAPPARLVAAPHGKVLAAHAAPVALVTGFLGGASLESGALQVSCPRFGRDFASVAAIALDGEPLERSRRILVTAVARAENQGMKWNAARTSVGADWGRGPTIAELVPARLSLAVTGRAYRVYALAPDGSRRREITATVRDGRLEFSASSRTPTLHYEIVPK